MNIVLWILQGVLAWLCLAGGAFQIFKIDQLQKTVVAMRELPRGLWAFLGALGCLCGVALILPGALRVMPTLTPIAAVVVAAQSVLITAFYLRYGDRAPISYTVAMVLIAAFVAYGRFALHPL